MQITRKTQSFDGSGRTWRPSKGGGGFNQLGWISFIFKNLSSISSVAHPAVTAISLNEQRETQLSSTLDVGPVGGRCS